MKRYHLGELEEIVLLIVGNLGDEAYGAHIKQEVKNRCNRNVSLSTIHTTLYRLDKKDYVSSRYDTSAEKERRGRPKLIFSLTAKGYDVLKQIFEMRSELWQGLSFQYR